MKETHLAITNLGRDTAAYGTKKVLFNIIKLNRKKVDVISQHQLSNLEFGKVDTCSLKRHLSHKPFAYSDIINFRYSIRCINKRPLALIELTQEKSAPQSMGEG